MNKARDVPASSRDAMAAQGQGSAKNGEEAPLRRDPGLVSGLFTGMIMLVLPLSASMGKVGDARAQGILPHARLRKGLSLFAIHGDCDVWMCSCDWDESADDSGKIL